MHFRLGLIDSVGMYDKPDQWGELWFVGDTGLSCSPSTFVMMGVEIRVLVIVGISLILYCCQ